MDAAAPPGTVVQPGGLSATPETSIAAIAASHARGGLTSVQAVDALDVGELYEVLAPSRSVVGLRPAARGQGVSPGVVAGAVVFSSEAAVAARASGLEPVLVLSESRPKDLPGLLASVAVVTERGGWTAHAAVVARALGRPAVAGLFDAVLEPTSGIVGAHGESIGEKAIVTVDGNTGVIYRGRADVGGHTDEEAAQLMAWLNRVLDDVPSIQVKANADTAEMATRARDLGADGVGLCRIEHLFLGEDRVLLERLLLARPGPDMSECLDAVYELLREEFSQLFATMDGRDAVIRLLDPPRHEFLPDPAQVSDDRTRAMVNRLREHNPMLGIRGVRVGILAPALVVAQLRALIDAAATVSRRGGDPRPELLVPMVTTPGEVDLVLRLLADVKAQAGSAASSLSIRVGAMVETPRAAFLVSELVERVDSLSLGTNDLTALIWGLSRDDADRELLPAYRRLGLVDRSPLESLDLEVVGPIILRVIKEARRARPGVRIGVCGEQAADPQAVRFLVEAGVDYISCAAPQVPLIRVIAAQQRLTHRANAPEVVL